MITMTQAFDTLDQFDLWDALDEETVRLTQTSDFWNQVQYEVERMDMAHPVDYVEPLGENDIFWNEFMHPQEQHLMPENLINNDCMWAGDDLISPANTFVSSDPITSPTPGQSLLRREISPSRPDTPPTVEGDEPPQFRHTVDVASTARRLLRNSAVVAADHSYTLSLCMNNLGVQTPSDSCESEEEIDVVSVPIAQEQQSSTERAEDYTLVCPAVIQYTVPQPSASPTGSERQHIQRCVATLTNPKSARSIGKKRSQRSTSAVTTIRRRARGAGRRARRRTNANSDSESDAESPDSERRSLHNDMERLRRVGLKNLFEELKQQIPATRDKERAPKVVILREATDLCNKLNLEDLEREKLIKKQDQLITKLKKLRTRLSRYRTKGGVVRTPY